MMTLSNTEVVTLTFAILSVGINVIQAVQNRNLKKNTLTPIYNGLIGLFNDVKQQSAHYFHRRQILYAKGNPYTTTKAIKWNFWEFIAETISHLQVLREHMVSLLKTIEPKERTFKESEFALTREDKELREQAQEQSRLRNKIESTKLRNDLARMQKTQQRDEKVDDTAARTG